MAKRGLTLSVLPGLLAVCRLDAQSPIPDWACRAMPYSITRTSDELSVVCPQERLPDNVRCERDWRCLKVQGPLDLSLTGILASLAGPLADAGISLFAFSTYDTDYVMVRQHDLERAIQTLRRHGHCVR